MATSGLGGTATFSDSTGLLAGFAINYSGRFSPVASGNARVIPGDVFLDVSGAASPSYLFSGSDNAGYWAGYGIRDRHPYAWNGGGSQIGTGSLAGFNQLASGGTLSFGFGNGVAVGTNVTIGFAPSCANDVLLANVSAPVPEPSAALIFGIGLAAVTRGQRALRRA